MEFLVGLVVFTLIAVLAWPYLYVWRLDGAVAARDMQALGRLVDLESGGRRFESYTNHQ